MIYKLSYNTVKKVKQNSTSVNFCGNLRNFAAIGFYHYWEENLIAENEFLDKKKKQVLYWYTIKLLSGQR